jgi:hypothetical protein
VIPLLRSSTDAPVKDGDVGASTTTALADPDARRRELHECVSGIRALAHQLRITERLWTSREGPEYVALIERTSCEALELLGRLQAVQRAPGNALDRTAGG